MRMSRINMLLAGAVTAVACLVASGPAFATATTLLLDDGPLGTTLIASVDGSVTTSFGPVADHQGITNSFSAFVTGSFSFPITDISIIEPGTTLVSDDLEFSQVNLGGGNTRTIVLVFGSNDGPPINLITFNPITENGLVQTLFSTQDEQGDTLKIQFLSEGDAPGGTTNSVPEPSTFALFGAALAAFGLMMRRRTARSHT